MKELQLTITLPSLQVSIPEDELNFQHLEQFVFQLTKIVGQHVIQEILQSFDNKLRKEREGGTLFNCGKRHKYLLTLLGNITYQKYLYRDRKGHYHCLLDETLGLRNPISVPVVITRRPLAYFPLSPAATAMLKDSSDAVSVIR